MEQAYWLGRKRASLAMARNAASSTSRLIHYHLAGSYSVKAARSAADWRPERLLIEAPTQAPHPNGYSVPLSGEATANVLAGWLSVSLLSE